jgi:regulation of enolase protein 1 (concanavalin A-like superfamily)
MRVFKPLVALFLVLLPSLACGHLLQVNGTRIVNSSNNQEVILNAVNFGNWMVMEGYLMNSTAQAPAQHDWKQKLTNLVGPENVKTFYDAWLANHVTPADIHQVKNWGFNAVRLPLHFEYFVNRDTPDEWNEQGFILLDNVISWCAAAGIYAIIDLHATPGAQSNNDISDYDNTRPSLWDSVANQDKTVRLWQRISERYKNQPWVAGYDLINEPAWDIPGGTLLRTLYVSITDAIRANGDKHILFIEGNWYSNDYTGLTPAWDPQIVYVFHKYWSSAESPKEIQWVLDLRTAQNRPIWCGEHGENSNDHFTKMVELLRSQGIGMSWWPMKKFKSINGLADATFPAGYQDLLDHFGGTKPDLKPTAAFTTLMELADSVRLENCRLQTEVIRSIQNQPGNRDTAPFTQHQIPGRIHAADYDQGMNGHAYSDSAWENYNLTTSNYTASNEGWSYRNNGVDVQTCADALSNGYNVGWFVAPEWMRYTVTVATPGTYRIELRVAKGGGDDGKLEIQDGDGLRILASATIPDTGGDSSYQTIVCSGGFATEGTQAIRLANVAGSYNIASVNFIWENATVPPTTPAKVPVRTVTQKASNGLYVTYRNGDRLASSTAASAGTRERFTLTDAGAGRVALRASNGKYVRLNTTDSKLYADAANIGTDERFVLTNLSGALSLRGSNDFYVSSEGGSTDGLTCTRSYPAGWEYFQESLVAISWVPAAAAPAAPQGLEATVTGQATTLNWDPVSGASHYTVKRATQTGGPYSKVGTYLTEPEFTDHFAQKGLRYCYAVVAHAGNVFGPTSEEVSFTIPGLPTAWLRQDIGKVGIAGSFSSIDESSTLQGSGADIWGNEDAFSFVSQNLGGDCVITARLVSMSNTDHWAKVGLMMRESNAANAKNVALLVTPEAGGTRLQYRNSDQGSTSDHQLSGSNAPLWLRIVRSGHTFTAWQSNDGETWTNSHAVTLTMNSDILVGLAVTSHKNDTLNTAVFDNISLAVLPPGTSSWHSFQNTWFSAGQLANANLSAPDADANHDGLANLFAYTSGISPWLRATTGNGGFPVVGIQNGFLSITYSRLRRRFDFECIGEVSSDLKTWNSGAGFTLETEVIPLDDVREQVTVRDAVPNDGVDQRFMRLRGTLLP